MARSLLISNDYPPIVSGISTYFYELWRHLPQGDAAILAPKAPGDREFDEQAGLEVVRKRVPIGLSKWQKFAKMFLNGFYALYYVKRFGVQKLHCGQILSTGPAGILCKKLFGLPFALYVYGSETVRFGHSKLLVWIMRKVCEHATEIVPNSRFTANEYLTFGVDPAKLRTITPGVDPSFFRPAPPRPDLVSQYKPNGETLLLTVSRLDERKGHDSVIRAMKTIVQRAPQTKYLIVGKGREQERLAALVSETGLEGKVQFAGYVPTEELPDYYNLSDIFVLPNRETEDFSQLKGDFEGFGIVFLEANACGKPVVAGRSGGVEDAVVDGETGLLIDPRAEDELTQALLSLIDDPERAKRMGEQGRVRAEQEFDWRLLADQVKEIIA